MNRNKIQALKKITFVLLMTTTLSDQTFAQTEDENKEKSTYVQRVRKKEADIDNLKAQLISREKELSMLKAKKEARKAAMMAAESSAKSIIGDEKKAHNIALSLVKHKRFHQKTNQEATQVRTVYERKKMLRGLAKNAATQAATRAATQKAYEILKDNDQALEVVKSLRIGEVNKKANPKGEAIVRTKPSSKRIVTMKDIRNSNEENKKELVNNKIIRPNVKTQSVDKTKEDKHKSTIDKAKTAIEIGDKTIEIGLKIGKVISELIVH